MANTRPIAGRDLVAGNVIVSNHKGKDHRVEVTSTPYESTTQKNFLIVPTSVGLLLVNVNEYVNVEVYDLAQSDMIIERAAKTIILLNELQYVSASELRRRLNDNPTMKEYISGQIQLINDMIYTTEYNGRMRLYAKIASQTDLSVDNLCSILGYPET